MKEILAGWIVFQLLVIGLTGGALLVDAKNNCQTTNKTPLSETLDGRSNWGLYLASMAFPIAWFIPPNVMSCEKLLNETK